MYPLVQPRIPPQPLRGVVAQYIRKPPPAKRYTHIRQRKLCRAEPALVGIVADAQVELPDAVLMQAAIVRSMTSNPGEQFDQRFPALLMRKSV
jgi:hypothetical protein